MIINKNIKTNALGRYWNKSPHYFSVMKKNTPEKYNFIMGFDEDRLEATKKYNLYVRGLLDDMEALIAKFEVQAHFIKWVNSLFVYNGNSINNFEAIIYGIRPDYFNVQFTSVQRFAKILEASKIFDHLEYIPKHIGRNIKVSLELDNVGAGVISPMQRAKGSK